MLVDLLQRHGGVNEERGMYSAGSILNIFQSTYIISYKQSLEYGGKKTKHGNNTHSHMTKLLQVVLTSSILTS
jgi:hypothetical protein